MSSESHKLTVPWTGLDVLLFVALFFAAQIACGVAMAVAIVVTGGISPPQVKIQVQETGEILVQEEEKKHHGHPIHQLIEYGKNSPLIILIVFLAVVVAAPLVEEIIFRLFIQGWLEAKLSQFSVPGASSIAIVFVSLFFAAIHGGSSENITLNIYAYLVLFITMTIASLSIFALGIYYLMGMRNMKMSHCLFGTKRLPSGQLLVIVGRCVAALLFVIGLSAVLHWIAPNTNTDPIPIFFFSLTLGILYSKTRNLSYCILLHACLNLTSLTVTWFTV